MTKTEETEETNDNRLSLRDSIALDFYRESVKDVTNPGQFKIHAIIAKEKADIILKVLGGE